MPHDIEVTVSKIASILRKRLTSAKDIDQDIERSIYTSLHALKYIATRKDGSGWQFTNKGKSINRWKNYNKLALAVEENLDGEEEKAWALAEKKAKEIKKRQQRVKKDQILAF